MTKKKTELFPATNQPLSLGISARCALEKERQHLLEEIRRNEAQLIESQPTSGHEFSDMAEHTAQDSQLLALQRLCRARLYAVDRAIARLEKGTYGLCEHCGKPISPERLEALPSTTLCIDCARLQEPNPAR